MKEKVQRNPFISLCEYAFENNWCWKISCSTCGHGNFRVAFSKIIRGQHPDDNSFWSDGKDNGALLKENNIYNDFWNGAHPDNQRKLALIVSGIKIRELQKIAKFPDWLGYIGLVIAHCSVGFRIVWDKDDQTLSYSRKIISESFIPQFMELLGDKTEPYHYLKEKIKNKSVITIRDLEIIEEFISNKK